MNVFYGSKLHGLIADHFHIAFLDIAECAESMSIVSLLILHKQTICLVTEFTHQEAFRIFPFEQASVT